MPINVKESLYKMFDAKAISAYWTNVNANMDDPYIGSSMFPVSKRTGLDLAFIKGKNQLPVALQLCYTDTVS